MAAAVVAVAEAGKKLSSKGYSMFSKTHLIKAGITIVTIGLMVINIAMVSGYAQRSKESKAAQDGLPEFGYNQPLNNAGEEPGNAGAQPDYTETKKPDGEDSFIAVPVSEELRARMTGKSYSLKTEISFKDLSYVKVLYYGFDGKTHEGELVVNRMVEKDILEIFKTLYNKKYPIAKMVLVDEYGGNDDRSMADNNTSAFCWREVFGSKTFSMHAYGLAVDINPVLNPSVTVMPDGSQKIRPPGGAAYLFRTDEVPGLIIKGDACYEAFTSHGWEWGGEWTSMKDYQHFFKNVPGYSQN